MPQYHILAINPGSTSTKIGVFCDETPVFVETVKHTAEELAAYEHAVDQQPMRKNAIMNCLERHSFALSALDAIVARGGPLPPVQAGAYAINQTMIDVIHSDRVTEHVSLVAAPIALEMAGPLGIPAYIYDAVSTDEMDPVAKISGYAPIERPCNCHTLNTKAMARKVAARLGGKYERMTFIAVHMGGGISTSLHHHGRIIDVLADEENSFSPDRPGRLPGRRVLKLCAAGQPDGDTLRRQLYGHGGLVSYLHTNNVVEALRRVEAGDSYAELIMQAMICQIAKGVGEMATVAAGKVDGIILTGGMANSAYITGGIEKRVSFIAPVYVMPGENELEALALGALKVLRGEEQAKEYTDH